MKRISLKESFALLLTLVLSVLAFSFPVFSSGLEKATQKELPSEILQDTKREGKSGIFSYWIKEGTVSIELCEPSAQGAISIPSQLEGYPVTEIAAFAFCECAGITSVTIPSTVKTIGNGAFSSCTALISIVLPGSFESIDQGVFSDSSLKHVYYEGTELQASRITVGKNNALFETATWHYDYCYTTGTTHAYADEDDMDCGNCDYDRTPYITGDLDGDEKVTSADAVYLLYHTLFPERYLVNQPVNFDGVGDVTSADAVYLLYHTLFPARYPI